MLKYVLTIDNQWLYSVYEPSELAMNGISSKC